MSTYIMIFVIVIVVSIFMSCQRSDDTQINSDESKTVTSLKELQWIIGTWLRETPRGIMYESWKTVNDTLCRGKVYRVAETDTTILERLSLEIVGDEIFYVPVVPHNEGAVYFRMIDQSPDKVVFENPDHDFPQRIIYMKMSNDSLHARIEGKNEGVESSVDFYFKRIN